jgi:hypothetical protein
MRFQQKASVALEIFGWMNSNSCFLCLAPVTFVEEPLIVNSEINLCKERKTYETTCDCRQPVG